MFITGSKSRRGYDEVKLEYPGRHCFRDRYLRFPSPMAPYMHLEQLKKDLSTKVMRVGELLQFGKLKITHMDNDERRGNWIELDYSGREHDLFAKVLSRFHKDTAKIAQLLRIFEYLKQYTEAGNSAIYPEYHYGEPYIIHAAEVSSTLVDKWRLNDFDMAITGFLHNGFNPCNYSDMGISFEAMDPICKFVYDWQWREFAKNRSVFTEKDLLEVTAIDKKAIAVRAATKYVDAISALQLNDIDERKKIISKLYSDIQSLLPWAKQTEAGSEIEKSFKEWSSNDVVRQNLTI